MLTIARASLRTLGRADLRRHVADGVQMSSVDIELYMCGLATRIGRISSTALIAAQHANDGANLFFRSPETPSYFRSAVARVIKAVQQLQIGDCPFVLLRNCFLPQGRPTARNPTPAPSPGSKSPRVQRSGSGPVAGFRYALSIGSG